LTRTKPIWREVGQQLWVDSVDVATALATHYSVLCVCAGAPQSDVYDECDRIVEHVHAKNHQDTGFIPERTGGAEATVSGIEKCHGEMAENGRSRLGGGSEPDHSTL